MQNDIQRNKEEKKKDTHFCTRNACNYCVVLSSSGQAGVKAFLLVWVFFLCVGDSLIPLGYNKRLKESCKSPLHAVKECVILANCQVYHKTKRLLRFISLCSAGQRRVAVPLVSCLSWYC